MPRKSWEVAIAVSILAFFTAAAILGSNYKYNQQMSDTLWMEKSNLDQCCIQLPQITDFDLTDIEGELQRRFEKDNVQRIAVITSTDCKFVKPTRQYDIHLDHSEEYKSVHYIPVQDIKPFDTLGVEVKCESCERERMIIIKKSDEKSWAIKLAPFIHFVKVGV